MPVPHSEIHEPAAIRGEEDLVANALTHIVWRMRVRDGLATIAIGLAVSGCALLIGQRVMGIFVAAGAAGLTWRRGQVRRTQEYAAACIERAHPQCRNVVITAEEMRRRREPRLPWVWTRVMQDAARHVQAVDASAIVPLTQVVLALVLVVCGVSALLVVGAPTGSRYVRATLESLSKAGTVSASTPLRVDVAITPPAYTKQPRKDYTDPDRIDAIEGSTVRLRAAGGDGRWRMRFGTQPLRVDEAGEATTALTTLAESGYVAIEPRLQPSTASDIRLIPVSVVPDHAPTVRVVAPGHDIVVPDAGRTVKVEASATDDFGLRSLEVLYTRVSGSGEQFSFEEGSLPVTLRRESQRSWQALGEFQLASLKLAPGDAVVYRAVGRDDRSGDRGLATSESFVIEIATPAQTALEGFEMPPDQERYALSQQMIVLRIQRLRARERSLDRAAVAESAAAIAVEQRAVRANFIFLMGGEVEDQEPEAGHSTDVQVGRVENTAQKEVTAAIAEMTRTEQALLVPDTAAALKAAQAAVAALQRAFGPSRYILRTTPTRGRIDSSRRLSGDLSAARDWRRDLEPSADDRRTRQARALLADLLEVAATSRGGQAVAHGMFTELAERALAIDPNDAVWQDVARRLDAARALSRTGGDVHAELARAIRETVIRTNRSARMADQAATRRQGPLVSAWAGERRP